MIVPTMPNDCTYHATMATEINTLQIFLPTENTKILHMKYTYGKYFLVLLRNL